MMKKLLIPAFLFCAGVSIAQPDTLILKPGPQEGQDAIIFTSFGCTFWGDSSPGETMNYGHLPDMRYGAWTYNGRGCGEGASRSLIRFAGLNALSPGTSVVSARLYLYGVSESAHYANSNFPGSEHGTTNEGWIKRVTSDWSENTVTWNMQPSATDVNRKALPVTTSHFNFDMDLDVTQLVQDILASDVNYGFLLRAQTEAVRRNVVFATSDHLNPALWPELVIIYNNPVSVAQVNAGAHLSIAPNPATNAVQVALPENHNGSVALQVTDITGKVIYRQQTTGQQQLTFSVAGWAKGLYLVQVTGSNWRAVEKLNVQ